ncbi:hypothetical protein DFH06DRAFT_1441209 [Mycena polygramma]|nr:hypothetical protein DFH06DRAFT_1441209 [Mycena polygramma]
MPNENIRLLAPVHGRLHQLQELSFRSDVPLGTPNRALNAFEVAPELRIVRFDFLGSIDEIHVLPFRQIQTVEFSTAGSSFCCDALLQFPNVQELVVTDCRGGSAQHPQLQVTLKKITLGRDDGNQLNTMAVIRRLTAPNLEELHFYDYIWDATSITESLTRSACSLKILFLKNVRNTVFVGTYLFSTNILLRMLEGRAASLRFVNLVFTSRQVAAADRARFAALRTASPGIWRPSCLTEAREPAVQFLDAFCKFTDARHASVHLCLSLALISNFLILIDHFFSERGYGSCFKTYFAIHALPTETLSDIFRLADAAITPKTKRCPSALKIDLAQLANSPLLVLSRGAYPVYPMGTREDTQTIECPSRTHSGEAPLSVSLTCRDGEPPHPRIFHLLVQHSHRWETVSIMCSLAGVDTSGLRGRLPRLRALALIYPPETVDFLESIPSLNHLTVRTVAPLIHSDAFGAILRHKQLRSLSCTGFSLLEIKAAISSLPDLPVATAFYLGITNFQPDSAMPLPSTTAHISTLTCFTVHHPRQASSAIAQIFASLTLPSLQRVHLASHSHPELLEWPHTEFLALCARSDLGRCLKTLQIAEMRITERELMEVLSVLPALEGLEVGDTPGHAGEGDDTDSLLIPSENPGKPDRTKIEPHRAR